MASWMVHLRVADALFSLIDGLSETEFTVGNIAPDSGIPNKDWSSFSPSTDLSHFKVTDNSGNKSISLDCFVSSYFTKEMQKSYTKKHFSFYLGYLTHLIVDILWVETVFPMCISKDPGLYCADKKAAIWNWKKDFYDLDALFIRKNPKFRSFLVYENAKGFVNDYMDMFSHDAIDNRREYIVAFYKAQRDGLDREYKFFTESEMDIFVKTAADEIYTNLSKHDYSLITSPR